MCSKVCEKIILFSDLLRLCNLIKCVKKLYYMSKTCIIKFSLLKKKHIIDFFFFFETKKKKKENEIFYFIFISCFQTEQDSWSPR